MRRLVRSLVCAFGIWLSAIGLSRAEIPDPAAPAATAPAPAKVLVLLRLPPGHYRANSDYGDAYSDKLGRSGRRRIAAEIARRHGLTLAADWPIALLEVDCYVMSVPAGRSPEDLAARLSRDKRVAWAQPMNQFHARAAAHKDPLYAAQPAASLWRLADMHRIATGRNVRVAVVDSMIDAAHPDLAGQVRVSRNFAPQHGQAPEQHGTGVAGVIAAIADNGVGIAGVAPDAKLMALRACWQAPGGEPVDTVCDSLSLATALDYAITHRAQVINMSLSGPPDRLLGRLLDVAIKRGITVVGAFDDTVAGGGFPASHPGVVSAGADSTRTAAGGIFTAPGAGVPTTQPDRRWVLANGSSYAAAHVSGLFALLREVDSRGAGAQSLVAARSGAIDAYATLQRVRSACGAACPTAPAYTALADR